QRDSERVAAAFVRVVLARVIDQYATHQLRREAEEMRAVLQLQTFPLDHPQIGFIDERRRLQSMRSRFLAEIAPGQAAQLSLHQRRQLLQRSAIPVAPGNKQACDL